MTFAIDRTSSLSQVEQLILADKIPDDICPGASYEGSLDLYSDTEWGRHQALQPPRYASNEELAYDNQQMLDDFSDDVHPVEHNRAFHRVLQAALLRAVHESAATRRRYYLSRGEIVGLRQASVTHDIGENTHPDLLKVLDIDRVIGDIPRGKKTPEDREIEAKNVAWFYARLFPYLPDFISMYAQKTISHDAAVKETYGHLLYEAAHEWGEYMVGLRAGQLALEASAQGDETERTTRLRRISVVVLANVVPPLLDASRDFHFINNWLEAKKPLHAQIMSALAE